MLVYVVTDVVCRLFDHHVEPLTGNCRPRACWQSGHQEATRPRICLARASGDQGQDEGESHWLAGWLVGLLACFSLLLFHGAIIIMTRGASQHQHGGGSPAQAKQGKAGLHHVLKEYAVLCRAIG